MNNNDEPSETRGRLSAKMDGYGNSEDIEERKFQILMKAYETAVETRKLEIELFWKRSFFFWGFIASAFAAYAALRSSDPYIALVAACFGFVCSVAWTLSNRGSKFWQESWETKVERIEPVTEAMFYQSEKNSATQNFWLSARRYSVSKLAIALSDYSIIVWLLVIAWELVNLFCPTAATSCVRQVAIVIFVFFSLLYGAALLVAGRSSSRSGETLSPAFKEV